jgi:hypothetical protein
MPDGSGTNQGLGGVGRGLEVLGEYQQAAGSLQAFREAAEKVERDPNVEIADKIRNLNGNADRMTQLDGISAFTTAMVSMMAKLEKAGGDLELVKKNPDALPDQLMKKGLVAKLKLPERTALETLPLLIHQEGDTAGYLRTAWPEIVDQGLESSKGWTEKLKNQIKKDPVGTISLMVIGVGVAWAGWSLISKLWKDKKAEKEGGEDGKKADTEEKKNSWLKAKILIPIGIVIAAGILGRGALKKLLAGLGIEDLQKLLASGESIPEDIRKQIEEQKTKIERLEAAAKEKVAAAKGAVAKAGELAGEVKEEAAEILSDKETRGQVNYFAISEALIGLYCIDTEKFKDLKTDITVAVKLMQNKNVSDILAAYEKAKKDKREKISNSEVGIEGEVDETALYHACAIVAKANEQYKKITNKDAGAKLVKEFFEVLAKDPAIEISHNIHESLALQFDNLSIHSLDDLRQNLDKVFDGKEIEEIFDNIPNRDRYLESLSGRYDIDLSSFNNPKEKADFIRIVSELYIGSYNLKEDTRTIRGIARNSTESEKVAEAVVKFFEALQKNVSSVLIECVKRYDIKRSEPSKKDYDQILSKYLKTENLEFKDGIQFALLSEGIGFDKPTSNEIIGQSKDIAMIYMILKTLKKRDSEAHSKYLGNILDIAGKETADININVNFKPFVPYFKGLLDILWKRAKQSVSDTSTSLFAISDLSEDPDKIEKLSKMDTWEFVYETGKAGTMGALQIPKELGLTLYSNFKELFSSETQGSDIMKMIKALGGILFYSEHKGEGLGLVYLAGKYYFIKPIDIGADTFKSAFEGPGAMVKTYIHGTAPFIVFGAGAGMLRGLAGKSAIETGIGLLSGALRGAVAPVSLPIAGYRAIRGTGRILEVKIFNSFAHGAGNLKTLEKTARLFDYYQLQAPGKGAGFLHRLEFAGKHPLDKFRRLIYSDIYSRARARWANNFTIAYNDFFGINPEMTANALTIKTADESLLDIARAAKRMRGLIPRLSKIPNIDSMEPEKLFDEFKKIQAEGLLEHEEVGWLEGRIWKLKRDSRGEIIRQNGKAERLELDEKGFKKLKKGLSAKPSTTIFEKVKRWLGKNKGDASKLGEAATEAEGTTTGAEAGVIEAETAAKAGATEVAASKVTKISEGKYSYLGKEFEITEAEIEKKITDLKFEKAPKTEGVIDIAKSGEVQVTREEAIEMLSKEKYLETVKVAELTTAEAATVEKEIMDEAKKAGKSIEKVKIKSKLLKFFPVLKEMLGPAIAAIIIYDLETSQDKRKAVVECGVGLGTFMAGAKGAELLTRGWTPTSLIGMLGKGGIILVGGFASAMGLTESAESLINSILPNFMGDELIANEVIDMVEKITTIGITKKVVASAGKGVLKTGLEKIGIGSVGELLATKIRPQIAKKLGTFIAESIGEKIAVEAGTKAAAAPALEIPYVNIVVAAGMAAWIVYDVYQIAVLATKASTIDDLMKRNGKLPIKNIEPVSASDREALEAAFATLGKSPDKMNDAEIMEVMNSISDINFKITREGSSGYEEYHLLNGEPYSVKIMDENGELIMLTNEELNTKIPDNFKLPTEFKPWEIDYNWPKDKLIANYKLAIMKMKYECGWTKMDYEVTDDKTILIKSFDGNAERKITRSGDKWTVEGLKDGLTLYQAISMANMVNKVKVQLDEEKLRGATPHPFEFDGMNIDFDSDWNPTDTRILSEETKWVQFYQKIGLSKDTILDTLNKWYSEEYHYAYAG